MHEEKHKKAYTAFTRKEWEMFKLMLDGETHVSKFAKILSSERTNLANTTAAHVRKMRVKIHDENLPYTIQNHYGFSTYKVIQH